jgi:hypothetical protein
MAFEEVVGARDSTVTAADVVDTIVIDLEKVTALMNGEMYNK